MAQTSDDSEEEFEYGDENEVEDLAVDEWEQTAGEVIKQQEKRERIEEEVVPALPPKVMKATTSSSTALMLSKEMVRLQKRASSEDENYFTVDFVDDNVFHWKINLTKFAPDSTIMKSLASLQNRSVDVEMEFTAEFPMVPPKVSIRRPILTGPFIHSGALCLELLLDGWRSSYTVEAVCMQIIATLSEEGVTVQNDAFFNISDTDRARQMIKSAHAGGSWGGKPAS